MSIIRVGLAETKDFHDGYDRIFGKKDDKPAADAKAEDKEDEKKDDQPAK
ncbi:MAG: hypothetical protein ACRC33_02750 [Gemmataceae bacterium]